MPVDRKKIAEIASGVIEDPRLAEAIRRLGDAENAEALKKIVGLAVRIAFSKKLGHWPTNEEMSAILEEIMTKMGVTKKK